MRTLMVTALSILSFAASGYSATAKPITYFCDIKTHSAGGWIPDSGVYAVDPPTGAVVAFDKFIRYANKEAIQAEVTALSDKFIKFRWALKLPAKGNKNLTASYRARINRLNNTLTMSAFVGDDRSHRGTGKCKVQ